MYVASNGIKTAVILRDAEPPHPRRDWDNLGNMVCWHRRYNLGDSHEYRSPDDFAKSLASQCLSYKDLIQAVHDGKIEGLRLDRDKDFNGNDFCRVMAQETYAGRPSPIHWGNTEIFVSPQLEPLGDEDKSESWVMDNLMEYISANDLLKLCEESGKVAILPVYLYDHSMQSISTGSFVGRAHHAEWDSGQVGFIYVDKETAMKNMSMESDRLNVAMVLPEDKRIPAMMTREVGESVEYAMERNGYSPVKPYHIKNLNSPPQHQTGDNVQSLASAVDDFEFQLKNGGVFKKDRTLYMFSGHSVSVSNGFFVHPVATFNPDLKPLTEEVWKDRALRCLEAEVKEYDNYLQGEVYGYQLYEGLNEVDSCWGFNPGSEDIKDLMKEELGYWLTPDMEFEIDYDEKFDIDSFYNDNDFPALRDKIRSEVESAIEFHGKFSPLPYPFGIPVQELLANKDGILRAIIEDLYDEHVEHDSNAIYESIIKHTGESREVKPKITMADLEPDKDYTAEELVALVQKKASLNDMIQAAQVQSAQQAGHNAAKHINREEHDLS